MQWYRRKGVQKYRRKARTRTGGRAWSTGKGALKYRTGAGRSTGGRACIRAGGRASEWGVEEGEREDMQVQEVERAGVRGRAGRSTGEGAQERRREGGQGGAWLHIHGITPVGAP
jgi:hypothetical protein